MTKHKLIFGDSRSMKDVPDKSVQLIVTSPPYWQLKDYGASSQIGFNDTYEGYINNLNFVWKECFRVLSDGCRLCINIGDQFARSLYYGRYKVIPIRTEIIRFCEAIGFDYMGAIIWQKNTTMHTSGGGAVMGSFPYPRNGILKLDYEFILIFKKSGEPLKVSEYYKKKSKLSKDEWKEYFSSHWSFSGVKQGRHLAMFPEELPKRLIKMFSFVGETVLDPFAGSGTTLLASHNLERNSIGYEINKEFKTIIQEKLSTVCNLSFFQDNNVFQNSFDDLPYIYKDPHKIDVKIDMKKMQFGSKIDKNSETKKDLYLLKKVISPEKIELTNGKIIKLIGVKTFKKLEKDAVDFLNKKFKNRRLFLKYDDNLQCQKGIDFAYVYLDNKTFINKHLLRTGFVDIDLSYDYKKKQNFIKTTEKIGE